MKEFIKNIFSINDYNETHKILKIFGIKFKFPKKEFLIKKRENPYYHYKNNNIDITTLPKATGQIRDIQLANLALLKELDYVCKKNDLKYWIDFGTVLGATRHKGFIPWDDDIDVSMLREDYEKIKYVFNNSTRNPDLFIDYSEKEIAKYIYIVKVQHKKCPHLFVDIFPYDFYGEKLSKQEQYKISTKIKLLRKEMQKKCNNKDIKENISNYRNKILKQNKIENSDLVFGIDFNHNWKKWLYSYDTIFPLSEATFEGFNFPCANKKEKFLEEVYGNYMSYPKKIGMGHSMFLKLSDEELKIIKQLGNKND